MESRTKVTHQEKDLKFPNHGLFVMCFCWSGLGNRVLLILCVWSPCGLCFVGGGFKSDSRFSKYFLKQRGTEGRQIYISQRREQK